jgi:hypothetical protein
VKYGSLTDLHKAMADSDVTIQTPMEAEPKRKRKTATPAPTEHAAQVALFRWANENAERHPELSLMFAIPNGGHRHRAVAARLKEEGVKAGVPDIFLPVPKGNRHGLWIELKRSNRRNHATPEQSRWLDALSAQGYAVTVCYGTDEAITAILDYLRTP